MSRLRLVLDVGAAAAMFVAAALVAVNHVTVGRGGGGEYSPPELPPPLEAVSLEDAATIGDPRAPVAIVEYADFECPYCRVFALEAMPTLREHIKDGRVFLAFRHMALERHQLAAAAGRLAECGRDVGLFWQAHDAIFQLTRVEMSALRLVAERLGIGESAEECLAGSGEAGQRAAERLRRDKESAVAFGVTGTPTLFVGTLDAGGTAVRVRRHFGGVVPAEMLTRVIDEIAASYGGGD